MIAWRDKLVAFGVHFTVTAAVGLLAAGIIFFVWFPDPFQEMLGGSKLFLLLVGCDLALGPLISLVIYDRRKSKRQLYLDYSIVAAVQLGALIYGMFVSFQARPAYVVFVGDRIEVITAGELADEDLREAKLEEYRKRPILGPKFAAARIEAKDQLDALNWAFAGKDVGFRPKFFVPYAEEIERIKAKMQPLSALIEKHPAAKSMIAEATAGFRGAVAWLPLKHKRGFWTALLDAESANPIGYLPIDPY